jgi:two-component system, chemotaxis family, chemotaxis protein CheY
MKPYRKTYELWYSSNMAGKVLIVEDDATLSHILAGSLTAAGYEISQAQNSKEGISKALAERPDLILTNLYLPDMIAVEAITILKNNPVTSDIPIIVLTAASVKEWKDRALQAGAVEYLSKPISQQHLIEIVGRFCRPLLSEL